MYLKIGLSRVVVLFSEYLDFSDRLIFTDACAVTDLRETFGKSRRGRMR